MYTRTRCERKEEVTVTLDQFAAWEISSETAFVNQEVGVL